MEVDLFLVGGRGGCNDKGMFDSLLGWYIDIFILFWDIRIILKILFWLFF